MKKIDLLNYLSVFDDDDDIHFITGEDGGMTEELPNLPHKIGHGFYHEGKQYSFIAFNAAGNKSAEGSFDEWYKRLNVQLKEVTK